MTEHCCEQMRHHVELTCDMHPDRYECGDCLIDYWPTSQRYGIMIHDGGSSMLVIAYCPWCGSRLTDPENDAGHRTIDVSSLGFDDD